MADKIKTIDPFTNIPLAPLPTATSDNSGGTFLSNLRELNIGDGGANVFRADKQGIWLGGATFPVANFSVTMAGAVTANSFTVVGGTIRYGKTSFTDNTHTGYYFGSEGLYAGKNADTTLFKFTIGTGAFEYTGKVVADPLTSNLPAAAITGSITASQIGTVNATSITGTITAGQIGTIAANQITGQITASQINTITAGQITGSITSSQIGSVAASTITGSITSGQIGSVSATTITGLITAGQITSLTASQITGQLTATQIASVSASTITGSITSTQIGSVNASAITGSITASQITSIAATQITGSITSSQISSVAASTITGSITSSQIGSVSATAISGSITSGQIGSVSASVINGVIVTSQLADDIISNLALFATNLRPIVSVAVLPTLPDADYPVGAVVYLTTDMKLYRNIGTWSSSAAASDISGTLTASQIGSVNSSAITGLILAGQISSISATQITGSIQASQITSLAVTQLTGQLTATQIASVNATAITGSITAGQITSLTVGQLTGQLTASQIASVNASSITGSITSAQISSVSATSITGSITSSQISSVNASAISGSISGSQITSISTSQLTGSISAGQISSVYASSISGSISASQISSVYASAISGQIIAEQINSVNASAINGTISAGQIGSVYGSVITIGSISSDKIGSVNAGVINAGQLNVGGSGASAIVIAQGSFGNARLAWVGGSRMWEDTSSQVGINSIGSPMYIYVNSTEKIVIPSSGQVSVRGGVYCDGNLNVTVGYSARIASGYLRVNTSSSPSEICYVEGGGKFIGNLMANHVDPRAAGSYNCGGSTLWWYYVNTYGLTYHSMGFYDDGVTIKKDGKLVKVSDMEAIRNMRPHPTKKTKEGAPMLDKYSLPVEMFVPAMDNDGKLYPRDKATGHPIVETVDQTFDKDGKEILTKRKEIMEDADGEDIGQLLALSLGAIKELDSRIDLLEKQKQ